MKTIEAPRDAFPSAPLSPSQSPGRVPSSKILSAHLEKLAVVYIRQSSPQQVMENRESTARQYAFAEHAVALGWPRDRVLIIDEDLGKSGRTAEGRSGFQRLVTEVTLNHVGLVLGLEMSRLARSSRDWHNLFEMCAICDSLLADEDGVYDANDPNDRLLLGLKGIMSEMELHIMRNRLERGRDNKAQRGELFHCVPMGYVILPTGEVDFDPDEQARSVVHLVFDKFDELGSIYGLFHWLIRHDIQLPIRPQDGGQEGAIGLATAIHPNAGADAAPPDLRGGVRIRAAARRSGQADSPPSSRYRPWVPMEQWKVLLKDRLPAYISWDQYLKNRERVKQNQNGPGYPGRAACRGGAVSGRADRAGIVAGICKRLITPNGMAQYACNRQYVEATEPRCYGLAARAIDDLVAQQVLPGARAGGDRLEPPGSGGCRARAPASGKALASNGGSERATKSSWPSAAIKPSIQRTAWWPRRWNGGGRRL